MAQISLVFHLVGVNAHANSPDHLGDLQWCEKHCKRFVELDPDHRQRKIEVHERVYQDVEGGGPERCRYVVGVGQPAAKKNGYVVEPVEEDHPLLAQDQEDGVHQLKNLAYHEEKGVQVALMRGNTVFKSSLDIFYHVLSFQIICL